MLNKINSVKPDIDRFATGSASYSFKHKVRNHRATYVDEPSEWVSQLISMVNATLSCYNNIFSWQGRMELLHFHSYQFSLSTVPTLHTVSVFSTTLIKHDLLLSLSRKASLFLFKYKCIYCIKSSMFHIMSLNTSPVWRGSYFCNTSSMRHWLWKQR